MNTKLLGHHLLRVEGIQNAASMYRGKNACIVASGIANIIENFPPIIQDGELIVGYIIPTTLILTGGFARIPRNIENYFKKSDSQKKGLIDTLLQETKYQNCLIMHQTLSLMKLTNSWIRSGLIGRCISDNHSVIGYEDVLKYGFEGLLKRFWNRA